MPRVCAVKSHQRDSSVCTNEAGERESIGRESAETEWERVEKRGTRSVNGEPVRLSDLIQCRRRSYSFRQLPPCNNKRERTGGGFSSTVSLYYWARGY